MDNDQTWQDVLKKAAAIVEEGWCQGTFHLNKDGVKCYRSGATKSCASGAISRAVGADYFAASALELYALGKLTESIGCASLITWNDHTDRTAVEVAEAMRQAATDG